MSRDYYEILGVSKNATPEEVKAAYRKLAMQCHPDRNPGNEKWAEERFREINEAYGILGDAQKKLNYDAFGDNGNVVDVLKSPHTRSEFNDVLSDFERDNLGFDFLDSIFGDLIREFFAPSDGWWSRDMLGVPIIRDIHCLVEITPKQAKKGIAIIWGRRRRWYELKIPAGVKTEQEIRYRGMGREVGGLAGDLYFHIKILNY